MVLVLKIKFEEDTRRLTVESAPTFAQLIVLVKQLFPNLREPFQVKYEDEDRDLITITTDLELKECVNVGSVTQSSLGAPVLRLFLTAPQNATPAPSTPVGKEEVQEPIKAEPQAQQNPFAALMNSPLAQLLNNPALLQMAAPLLSNPQMLQSLMSQWLPTTGQQSTGTPDLAKLFQGLGLNGQTTSTEQQTPQQFFAQLFNNPMLQQFIPQMTSMFNNVAPTGQTPPPSTKEEEEQVHSGVICDGCGNGISGTRYKCSNCPDYDLCQTCEKKGGVHDSSHVFLKITKPVNQSAGRSCPYRRAWGEGSQGNNAKGWGEGSQGNNGKERRCGRWGAALVSKPDSTSPQQPRYFARFVADVTVEDGTSVNPGQSLVKIWKLRNESTVAWPENTRLLFVGGDRLANVEAVGVPDVQPGAEVDIAVDMIAPSKPGRYVGYWRLVAPDGTRFGQRVWVDITVPAVSVSPAVPTTPATPATPVQLPTPTPVVAVTPPLDKPTEAPVSAEHQQLLDMGFLDKTLNMQLLAKNNNDVLRTVQDLLRLA